MHHNEIVSTIQNLTNKKPTLKDFASVLGVSVSGIGNRAQRNSQYSVEEIRKLEEYFKCDILGFDKNVYINKLVSDYTNKFTTISPEVKELLMQYYNQGIDLNWLITGKGNKFRLKQPDNFKSEIKQAILEMIKDGELSKDELI